MRYTERICHDLYHLFRNHTHLGWSMRVPNYMKDTQEIVASVRKKWSTALLLLNCHTGMPGRSALHWRFLANCYCMEMSPIMSVIHATWCDISQKSSKLCTGDLRLAGRWEKRWHMFLPVIVLFWDFCGVSEHDTSHPSTIQCLKMGYRTGRKPLHWHTVQFLAFSEGRQRLSKVNFISKPCPVLGPHLMRWISPLLQYWWLCLNSTEHNTTQQRTTQHNITAQQHTIIIIMPHFLVGVKSSWRLCHHPEKVTTTVWLTCGNTKYQMPISTAL